jgi:hypothetical protein
MRIAGQANVWPVTMRTDIAQTRALFDTVLMVGWNVIAVILARLTLNTTLVFSTGRAACGKFADNGQNIATAHKRYPERKIVSSRPATSCHGGSAEALTVRMSACRLAIEENFVDGAPDRSAGVEGDPPLRDILFCRMQTQNELLFSRPATERIF